MSKRAPNLLFINQHNNTFKEEAKEYGLADTSYSSQAVFFDYDKDGDLDMYLANYMLNASYSANNIFPKNLSGYSLANDKLYRNDGISKGSNHPHFTDVSIQAGIKEDGLGVAVSDFNNDGWPDLYVANDFVSNDELWMNNKNGTFTNVLDMSTKHQSYSSMGCDAADINNDGNIDLLLAGNEYQTEVITGRYDASYGCFLKGHKNKTFTYISPAQSGFLTNGDVKDMKMITTPKGGKLVLVALNNDYLKVFKIK